MTKSPARGRSTGRSAPRRKRRSAEEAREQILDAAEKRFAQGGPRGIRLQDVAADVGVSHPTVLHHFGSREALLEAVVHRALDTLQGELVAAFGAPPTQSDARVEVFRKIIATLGDRGHARLMAWLALEDNAPAQPHKMLLAMARVLHARRAEENLPDAPFDETRYTVLLVALALFAEGLLGDAMMESAGLADTPAAREKFHAWLLRLVEAHLHGLGSTAPRPA